MFFPETLPFFVRFEHLEPFFAAVLGGLLAPKMDTPAPAPAPDAVTPAPAAPPAATPTQAGPSDVVSEGARRLIGKGKKSVTVSRTAGGGVGLNV